MHVAFIQCTLCAYDVRVLNNNSYVALTHIYGIAFTFPVGNPVNSIHHGTYIKVRTKHNMLCCLIRLVNCFFCLLQYVVTLVLNGKVFYLKYVTSTVHAVTLFTPFLYVLALCMWQHTVKHYSTLYMFFITTSKWYAVIYKCTLVIPV